MAMFPPFNESYGRTVFVRWAVLLPSYKAGRRVFIPSSYVVLFVFFARSYWRQDLPVMVFITTGGSSCLDVPAPLCMLVAVVVLMSPAY